MSIAIKYMQLCHQTKVQPHPENVMHIYRDLYFICLKDV